MKIRPWSAPLTQSSPRRRTGLLVHGSFRSAAALLAMNNNVYALVMRGTDLYAGGEFTTAGGVAANHIAKWNGTDWSALGDGTDSSGWVRALAVSGSDLFVGGGFTSAGGVAAARYLAKWDGAAWSAVGDGLNGDVSALAGLRLHDRIHGQPFAGQLAEEGQCHRANVGRQFRQRSVRV